MYNAERWRSGAAGSRRLQRFVRPATWDSAPLSLFLLQQYLGRMRQACSSGGFPSSLDHAFVLSMRTNPDPDKTCSVLSGECAVMQTNTGRPQVPNFLKLQRGMVRIGFEQG